MAEKPHPDMTRMSCGTDTWLPEEHLLGCIKCQLQQAKARIAELERKLEETTAYAVSEASKLLERIRELEEEAAIQNESCSNAINAAVALVRRRVVKLESELAEAQSLLRMTYAGTGYCPLCNVSPCAEGCPAPKVRGVLTTPLAQFGGPVPEVPHG